jgi:hypothetical protein
VRRAPTPVARAGLSAAVLAAATAAAALHASRAHAAAERTLLAVGSNNGLGHEAPLLHAVDDARRVAALCTELGGVGQSSTRVLADPSPAAVLQAVAALGAAGAGAGAGAGGARPQTVFIYISSHGDDQSLHFGGERLPLGDLQAAVAALPAPLKVMVIDACRSPGMRDKGLERTPSFAVSLPASPGEHEGLVTVLASRRGETAHESARLEGGVFTHYLVSGLRGAADRDGDRRVTLAEAYEFAYGRTLARSVAATGAPQRPEMLLSLRGSGPLVVTQLDPARSRLSLPAGGDAHYFVYTKGSSAVVAEAWGRPEGVTTLALPAGRFVVQRQLGAGHGAAEVGLPFGGESNLTVAAFVPVTPERMLERGGRIELYPHAVGVAGGAISDRDLHLGPAIHAWYGWTRGALMLQGGLGLGGLDYSTIYNTVESRHLEASAGVGRLWAGAWLTGYAIAEAATRIERQRLRDRSVVAPASGPIMSQGHSLGAGPGARLGLSLPLAPRLALITEATARAFLFRNASSRDDDRASWTVAPDFGLRVGVSTAF